MRDLPLQVRVSSAIHLTHSARAPIWAVISYGPRRVPGVNDTAVVETAVIIRGCGESTG